MLIIVKYLRGIFILIFSVSSHFCKNKSNKRKICIYHLIQSEHSKEINWIWIRVVSIAFLEIFHMINVLTNL